MELYMRIWNMEYARGFLLCGLASGRFLVRESLGKPPHHDVPLTHHHTEEYMFCLYPLVMWGLLTLPHLSLLDEVRKG